MPRVATQYRPAGLRRSDGCFGVPRVPIWKNREVAAHGTSGFVSVIGLAGVALLGPYRALMEREAQPQSKRPPPEPAPAERALAECAAGGAA